MKPVKILSFDTQFYRACDYRRHGDAVRHLNNALNQLLNCKIPFGKIVFLQNHRHILDFLDKCDSVDLINIDYHSDLSSEDDSKLHDENWAMHVKCKKGSKLSWYRPMYHYMDHKRSKHYHPRWSFGNTNCYCTDTLDDANKHGWGTLEIGDVHVEHIANFLGVAKFDAIFVVKSSDASNEGRVRCMDDFKEKHGINWYKPNSNMKPKRSKKEKKKLLEERQLRFEREALEIEATKAELAKRFELVRDAKFDVAWSIAWDYGHSNGFHEVKSIFEDLVELIKM